MKQIIDYILMVKTIPELSKRDGCVYTCSIGFSPQLGLIRVYPLPLLGMKRWGKYQIQVERNKRDNRPESWKLSSYSRFENFIGFEKDVIYKGDVNKDQVLSIAAQYIEPSISKLNEQRKSIGFIRTQNVMPYWNANDRFINTKQIGMFEDVDIADFCKYMKETKEKECRLKFYDGDGIHDLQLNDWQYYEYQRKHGANKEAFRYIRPERDKLILLGNMYNYRNNWLALGVYNLPHSYAPLQSQQSVLSF